MEKTQLNRTPTSGYSVILESLGMTWQNDNHYLVVEPGPTGNDRRVYISVVLSQIPEMLSIILPYFKETGLGFGIAKDMRSAQLILNGAIDYRHIGKIVIVFVPEQLFQEITKRLTDMLSHFNGPAIPAKRLIRGVLYSDHNPNSSGEAGMDKIKKRRLTFQQKYILLFTVKPDLKGDVSVAIVVKSIFNMRKCIIKEGKQFMISDEAGRDMKDRIAWQYKIHNELAGVVNVPAVVDLFEENGNSYLVMEYILGKNLGKVIDGIYAGRNWTGLSAKEKSVLLDLLFSILEMIEKIHLAGYVHRDLTTANFIITKTGKVYLIDWELAFSLDSQYPLPPFGCGTPGYLSAEQNQSAMPTTKEDIYGLGALMIVFFTGKRPGDFDLKNTADLSKAISFLSCGTQIAELITCCTAAIANERPAIEDIISVLTGIKNHLTTGKLSLYSQIST